MQENIYERIHRILSWKRVISFNAILLVILVVPLSINLAQQNTENRSGAAGEVGVAEVTPPPDYPVAAPKIERVSMFFGKKGDTIVILGNNFGAYKWDSKVFVGNVEATKEQIVRWSNTVLEVKIPDTARTGKVWVAINGKQADWEGSLLLYDIARAAQLGIKRVTSTEATVWITKGSGAQKGMIELGYVSEPVTVAAGGNIKIDSQTPVADALGKKLKVQFSIVTPLPSTETPLFNVNYPGIGTLEIVRAELSDSAGNLLQIYSDPLSVKLLP